MAQPPLEPLDEHDSDSKGEATVERILAHLESLPPDKAMTWFLEFVDAGVEKLNAMEAVAKKLGLKAKKKPKPREKIYVILGRDKDLPDSEGMDPLEAMIEGRYDRREEIRCALWASDEDDAVSQYKTKLGDLAPDLQIPGREITAEYLGQQWGKRVTMKTFFNRPRRKRYASLEEHKEELAQ